MERIDDLARKKFIKYVSLNILSMLGSSCYILADTFFIANGIGADGLTALNLAISVFSFIQATGLMIGIGAATRFAISTSRGDTKRGNQVFSAALITGLTAGLVIAAAGLFFSQKIAAALGANGEIIAMTDVYLKTIMMFAPLFILNRLAEAFIRNDHNPKLVTIAMLTGNFSNIVLDYVLIYIFKWSMFGAAFATGIAPLVSLCCLSLHFIKKKNGFRIVKVRLTLKTILDFCRLGISAFVNELSTGAVVMIFNFILLGLGGNVAVAAYGVIVNVALLGISVFTGIAQGIQPLVSDYHGRELQPQLKSVKRDAIVLAVILAVVIFLIAVIFDDGIVSLFNRENDPLLQQIAKEGLKIYFLSFLAGSVNIVIAGYLSAKEQAQRGFVISLMRGLMIIAPSALILSSIFGITGVWAAVPVTEAITLCAAVFMLRKK